MKWTARWAWATAIPRSTLPRWRLSHYPGTLHTVAQGQPTTTKAAAAVVQGAQAMA